MLEASTSLTIALDKGNHSYLLSVGRIGEYASDNWAYHQHDALGSVRQLTDKDGSVTLSRSYMPYGETLSSSGVGDSSYAFAGEWRDSTGLVFLRARYYSPWDGRFMTRDTWVGDYNRPLSLNRWMYVEGNPVNLTDPSGMFPLYCHKMPDRIQFEDCVRKEYGLARPLQYTLHASSRYKKDVPGCHYEVSPELPIPYDGQGYLEGHGVTALVLVNGAEVVYDFTTMSSAVFDIDGGFVGDSVIGFSISTYFGIIGNIDKPGNGFSSQRSIDDYSGLAISVPIGASLPFDVIVPTVGVYKSKFMSLSLNPIIGVTYGDYWGMSMDPIPILDFGVSITNANMRQESTTKYTYRNPAGHEYVDVGKLKHDILFGGRSPWKDAGVVFYAPLLPARLYASTMVDKWAKIYNDLHNGE